MGGVGNSSASRLKPALTAILAISLPLALSVASSPAYSAKLEWGGYHNTSPDLDSYSTNSHGFIIGGTPAYQDNEGSLELHDKAFIWSDDVQIKFADNKDFNVSDSSILLNQSTGTSYKFVQVGSLTHADNRVKMEDFRLSIKDGSKNDSFQQNILQNKNTTATATYSIGEKAVELIRNNVDFFDDFHTILKKGEAGYDEERLSFDGAKYHQDSGINDNQTSLSTVAVLTELNISGGKSLAFNVSNSNEQKASASNTLAAKLSGEGGVIYSGSGTLNINSWDNNSGNTYSGDTFIQGTSAENKLTLNLSRASSFGNTSDIDISNADVIFNSSAGDELKAANTITFGGNVSVKKSGNDNTDLSKVTAQNYVFGTANEASPAMMAEASAGSDAPLIDLSTIDIQVANKVLTFSGNNNSSVVFNHVSGDLTYSFSGVSAARNGDGAKLANVLLKGGSQVKYGNDISVPTEKTTLEDFSHLTVQSAENNYARQLGSEVVFSGSGSTATAFNMLTIEQSGAMVFQGLKLNSTDNDATTNTTFDRVSFQNKAESITRNASQATLTFSGDDANYSGYNGWYRIDGYALNLDQKLAEKLFGPASTEGTQTLADTSSLHGGLALGTDTVVRISGSDTVHINALGWTDYTPENREGILDLTGFTFDSQDINKAALSVASTYFVGTTTGDNNERLGGASVAISSDYLTSLQATKAGQERPEGSILDLQPKHHQLLIELNENAITGEQPRLTLLNDQYEKVSTDEEPSEYYSKVSGGKLAAEGHWCFGTRYGHATAEEDKNTNAEHSSKYGLWIDYSLENLELKNGQSAEQTQQTASDLDIQAALVIENATNPENNKLDVDVSGRGVLVFNKKLTGESTAALAESNQNISITGTNSYQGLTVVNSGITLHTNVADALGSSSLALTGNNSGLTVDASMETHDPFKLNVASLATDKNQHTIELQKNNILALTGRTSDSDNLSGAFAAIESEETVFSDTNGLTADTITAQTKLTGAGTLEIGSAASAGPDGEAGQAASTYTLTIESANSLSEGFTGTVKLIGESSLIIGQDDAVQQNLLADDADKNAVLTSGKYAGDAKSNIEFKNTDFVVGEENADFTDFQGTITLGAGVTGTVENSLEKLNSGATLNLSGSEAEPATFRLVSVGSKDTEPVTEWQNKVSGSGTIAFEGSVLSVKTAKLKDADLLLDIKSNTEGSGSIISLDSKDFTAENKLSAAVAEGSVLSLNETSSDTSVSADWTNLSGAGEIKLTHTAAKAGEGEGGETTALPALTFSSINEGLTGSVTLTGYSFSFGDKSKENNKNTDLLGQVNLTAVNSYLTAEAAAESRNLTLDSSTLEFKGGLKQVQEQAEDPADTQTVAEIENMLTLKGDGSAGNKGTINFKGNNTLVVSTDVFNIAEAGPSSLPDLAEDGSITGGVLESYSKVHSEAEAGASKIILASGSVSSEGVAVSGTVQNVTLKNAEGTATLAAAPAEGDSHILTVKNAAGEEIARIGYGYGLFGDKDSLYIGGGSNSIHLLKDGVVLDADELSDNFGDVSALITSAEGVNVVTAGKKKLILSNNDNEIKGALKVRSEVALGGNFKSRTLEVDKSYSYDLGSSTHTLTQSGSSYIAGTLKGDASSAIVFAKDSVLTVRAGADVTEMAGTYNMAAAEGASMTVVGAQDMSKSSFTGGTLTKTEAGQLTLGLKGIQSSNTALKIQGGSVQVNDWADETLNLSSVSLSKGASFEFTGKEVTGGFTGNGGLINLHVYDSAAAAPAVKAASAGADGAGSANTAEDNRVLHVMSSLAGSGNVIDFLSEVPGKAKGETAYQAQRLSIGTLAAGSNNTFKLGIDNTSGKPVSDFIDIRKATGESVQTIELKEIRGDFNFSEAVQFASVGEGGSNVTFKGTGADDLPDTMVRADKTTVTTAIAPAFNIVGEADGSKWYLERAAAYDEVSVAGNILTDMADSVYLSNVYMDSFDQRSAAAHYVNGQDYGIWTRVRYDDLSKDSAYDIDRTLVNVGATRKLATSFGQTLFTAALEYQRSDVDYDHMSTDSESDRYGFWLGTTFLFDEGTYIDLLARYAHIDNDNTIKGLMNSEVSADFDNDLFGLSFEMGHKFASDSGWFVQPQFELQYTYITGDDFDTSAGTSVSTGDIHSLMSRVGLKAGHSFTSVPVSVYVRADVMHEFKGDADVTFKELGNSMTFTEKHDDTYGVAGLGISAQAGEDFTLYLEGQSIVGSPDYSACSVTGGFKFSF